MGTNYYLEEDGKHTCHECGQPRNKRIHIGKSSFGWTFALRRDEEEGLVDLESWVRRMCSPNIKRIVDEYGKDVSLESMLVTIVGRYGLSVEKAAREMKQPEDRWFRSNHARPGPLGLARDANGTDTIGTWTMVDGEFR